MFDTLISWWESFAEWFAQFFIDSLTWWISFIIKTAFYAYDKFFDLFQSLIVNFPVPAAWANSDPWSNFSPQILYLLDKFMIVEVLAIISAAWSIRFMLNRIPFLRL
jgi:hypothetical protein